MRYRAGSLQLNRLRSAPHGETVMPGAPGGSRQAGPGVDVRRRGTEMSFPRVPPSASPSSVGATDVTDTLVFLSRDGECAPPRWECPIGVQWRLGAEALLQLCGCRVSRWHVDAVGGPGDPPGVRASPDGTSPAMCSVRPWCRSAISGARGRLLLGRKTGSSSEVTSTGTGPQRSDSCPKQRYDAERRWISRDMFVQRSGRMRSRRRVTRQCRSALRCVPGALAGYRSRGVFFFALRAHTRAAPNRSRMVATTVAATICTTTIRLPARTHPRGRLYIRARSGVRTKSPRNGRAGSVGAVFSRACGGHN